MDLSVAGSGDLQNSARGAPMTRGFADVAILLELSHLDRAHGWWGHGVVETRGESIGRSAPNGLASAARRARGNGDLRCFASLVRR
jgi:hypothetical protein